VQADRSTPEPNDAEQNACSSPKSIQPAHARQPPHLATKHTHTHTMASLASRLLALLAAVAALAAGEGGVRRVLARPCVHACALLRANARIAAAPRPVAGACCSSETTLASSLGAAVSADGVECVADARYEHSTPTAAAAAAAAACAPRSLPQHAQPSHHASPLPPTHTNPPGAPPAAAPLPPKPLPAAAHITHHLLLLYPAGVAAGEGSSSTRPWSTDLAVKWFSETVKERDATVGDGTITGSTILAPTDVVRVHVWRRSVAVECAREIGWVWARYPSSPQTATSPTSSRQSALSLCSGGRGGCLQQCAPCTGHACACVPLKSPYIVAAELPAPCPSRDHVS